ncbi:MAG TPA: MFS transporter, partial [Planctomycetota bacterium]|nr:MFS transporter [Planctomycetota bacterium]
MSGPFGLLARNAAYRRLWLSYFISFAGDWFTLVALVRFIHEATGERQEVGYLFAIQIFPSLAVGWLAGSVADRLPRRSVMIACDCVRAAGALAYLPLMAIGRVELVLALTLLQHSVTAFFRPAVQASVPHLVEARDLASAGALDGISWSLGLILGAALGGIAVDHVGVRMSFVIDAATFLASAALIRGLPLPRVAAAPRAAAGRSSLREFS